MLSYPVMQHSATLYLAKQAFLMECSRFSSGYLASRRATRSNCRVDREEDTEATCHENQSTKSLKNEGRPSAGNG